MTALRQAVDIDVDDDDEDSDEFDVCIWHYRVVLKADHLYVYIH